MHDSFTPIGVAVPLTNMLLGEIALGGLGSGLYSMVIIALLGAFLTGMMVGRTPEYLGKHLGEHELKQVVIFVLIMPAAVLLLFALAVSTDAGTAGLTTNAGAHGMTEITYAYASTMGNNGQTLAGLSANSTFYNLTTIVASRGSRRRS